LIGDFGADGMLFDLAAQYEEISPWSDRWPDFAETT
jgi:Asp-tRNA(Asn)/Glu-tRNA(Gln) amidotransferase A subunit family amidase